MPSPNHSPPFLPSPPERLTHIDVHGTDLLNDTPALVGDTFAFLGSEKRDWLAGRFVAVCWDMPELMARKEEIVEGDKLKFRMVM